MALGDTPMASVSSQSHHRLHSSWSNLTGDQFLSNLLTATKFLIQSIWNQPQYELDDRKIGQCVEAIRANADESDPVFSPDPIAFIYVFARVLWGLVPEDVVRRRKDEIYEVMGELAGIVVEEDDSSWLYSRKECVEWASRHFWRVDLEYHDLVPKLVEIVHTWDPEY